MSGGRYVSVGRRPCSVCMRLMSIDELGLIRKHRRNGADSPHCRGSDMPAWQPDPAPVPATVALASAPTPPPMLRGRLPLPDGRSFSYEVPRSLSHDDVRRIASSLLLHVDGYAEQAWTAAVAAGLVQDVPGKEVPR